MEKKIEEDLANSVVTLDGNEKNMDYLGNQSRSSNIIIACFPGEKVKIGKCQK